MTDIETYKPRNFEFSGVWNIDEVKFKTYLITTESGQRIQTEMIDNARQYVELAFPSIRRHEGHDHGLGYVVLHAGKMGNWLLIHWWAFHDIALRMLASAEPGNIEFKSEDLRRFHACVWEHVVIDHERDAWVRHMMADDSHPDTYLEDVLPNGTY